MSVTWVLGMQAVGKTLDGWWINTCMWMVCTDCGQLWDSNKPKRVHCLHTTIHPSWCVVGAGSLWPNQSSTSDANTFMEIVGVVKHLQGAFSRFFRYNIAFPLVDSFGKVMIFFNAVIFFSIFQKN